jgi:hypothetical protein
LQIAECRFQIETGKRGALLSICNLQSSISNQAARNVCGASVVTTGVSL